MTSFSNIFLKRRPEKEPNILKLDDSKLDIDRFVKQINDVKDYLKTDTSLAEWQHFCLNIRNKLALNTQHKPVWSLQTLPQVDEAGYQSEPPENVMRLIEKDTTNPKVYTL